MSVNIKGMKMPKSCKECRLTYDSSWCLLLDEPNECVEGGLMWKRCAETGRLADCPLEDVAPVVHAKWEKHDFSIRKCSACGFALDIAKGDPCWLIIANYCPSCGAKME